MRRGFDTQRARHALAFSWLIVLLPTWIHAGANDTKTLRQWLEAISRSQRQQSYEGTFVYRCNAKLVSLNIVHASSPEGDREKLMVLNGPEQSVLNNRNSLPREVSANRGAAMSPGFDSEVLNDEHLDQHYSLTLGSNDRVVGRATRVVHIRPRDEYRYGFDLWVDGETGLVLRSDMLDSASKIIEQILFTSIRFMPSTEALGLVGRVDKERTVPDATSTSVPGQNTAGLKEAGLNWMVERLPAGFALAETLAHPMSSSAGARRHLVYTDGLASVSVFIEEFSGEPFKGLQRVGAMNAFGDVVDGHQITVVGDVPTATVKLMGQSVRLAP